MTNNNYKTFRQLAPLWSQVFDMYSDIKDIKNDYEPVRLFKENCGLTMGDAERCVMGEAHGFTSDYDNKRSKGFCKTCFDFVGGIFILIDDLLLKKLKEKRWEDEKIIKDIEQHFNEVHLNKNDL